MKLDGFYGTVFLLSYLKQTFKILSAPASPVVIGSRDTRPVQKNLLCKWLRNLSLSHPSLSHPSPSRPSQSRPSRNHPPRPAAPGFQEIVGIKGPAKARATMSAMVNLELVMEKDEVQTIEVVIRVLVRAMAMVKVMDKAMEVRNAKLNFQNNPDILFRRKLPTRLSIDLLDPLSADSFGSVLVRIFYRFEDFDCGENESGLGFV